MSGGSRLDLLYLRLNDWLNDWLNGGLNDWLRLRPGRRIRCLGHRELPRLRHLIRELFHDGSDSLNVGV